MWLLRPSGSGKFYQWKTPQHQVIGLERTEKRVCHPLFNKLYISCYLPAFCWLLTKIDVKESTCWLPEVVCFLLSVTLPENEKIV